MNYLTLIIQDIKNDFKYNNYKQVSCIGTQDKIPAKYGGQ